MKVLAIVGPTAVGKTSLAIKLAKKYNGEIISCDSMQIYKYMDIGTAKPTKEEMEQMPEISKRVIEGVKAWATIGADRAMNVVNTRPQPKQEA